MAGVRISYISGSGDSAETQQLLNNLIEADQLSFYSLNVSKSQLLTLNNDYDNGIIPSGWTVKTRSDSGKIITEIDAQLSILGNRQIDISNNPDIEVETGYDEQFAEFIGNGIGVIPVIIIIVAIIVGGAVAYELIDYLEALTIDSDATVEQSEILKKAAMNLTPEDQKSYWNEIQKQIDKAYKGGYASGDGGSLFGDMSQFATIGLIGFGLYLVAPMLLSARAKYQSKSTASKRISGTKKLNSKKLLAVDSKYKPRFKKKTKAEYKALEKKNHLKYLKLKNSNDTYDQTLANKYYWIARKYENLADQFE